MQSNPLRRLLLFKNTVAFFGDFRNWNCDADFVRSLPELVLKTNEYLQLGAITGCLRISKESIFTGVNNFKNNSIAGSHYLDSFGFTEEEVEQMLRAAGLIDRLSSVKQWYDGYHFGKYDIYCHCH